jgi:hypothetical protein
VRVHSRGELTGDDGTVVRGHGDAVDGQRHAADNGDGTTAVRTLSAGGEQVGEVPRLAGVESSSPAAKILLPRSAIHSIRAPIVATTARITAAGHRR